MTQMLLIGILMHIIGDYYLQSNNIAEKKNKSFGWLMLHCAIYALPFALSFVFIKLSLDLVFGFCMICIGHFIIDSLKFAVQKALPKAGRVRCYVYIIDQILHFAVILAASYIFVDSVTLYSYVSKILTDFSISFEPMIKWLLIALLMYKPANITFSVLFSHIRPNHQAVQKQLILIGAQGGIEDDESSEKTDSGIKNAGGLIGFLERIMVVILLSLEQFSAIGLVLTAKSITRYEKITKEPKFAEYYLIGTLTSMLAAFLCYYAIFGF